MSTKQIARKILSNPYLLDCEGYSLAQLFKMRDALYVLDTFGKADLDLLREVEKWIGQKIL